MPASTATSIEGLRHETEIAGFQIIQHRTRHGGGEGNVESPQHTLAMMQNMITGVRMEAVPEMRRRIEFFVSSSRNKRPPIMNNPAWRLRPLNSVGAARPMSLMASFDALDSV